LLDDPGKALPPAPPQPDRVRPANALIKALRERLPPLVRAGYRSAADEDGKDEVHTFHLAAGGQRTFRLRLSAGGPYAVLAVAVGADDIDLTVYSPAGRLVTYDHKPDAHPEVKFRAAQGGRYFVVVHNPTTEDAVVTVVTMRKGRRAPGPELRP